METALNDGSLVHRLGLVRLAFGKRYSPQPMLCNSDGQIIPDAEGKPSRWVEYFSKFLNSPIHTTPPTSELTQSGHDADYSTPSPTEIADIVRRLKPKKAHVADRIPE